LRLIKNVSLVIFYFIVIIYIIKGKMPVQMPKKKDGIYTLGDQAALRQAAEEAKREFNSKRPTLTEQLKMLEREKELFKKSPKLAERLASESGRTLEVINKEIESLKSVMGPDGHFEIGGKSNKKSKKRRGKRSKKTRRNKSWSFF